MSRAVAGRPSSRKPSVKTCSRITLQEPRSIKTGLKRIADQVLGNFLSGETLRTLLNTEGYVWKRMRRSTPGAAQ